MTSKVINGDYASAYYLHAPTTKLIVRPSGYIAGDAKYGIHTPTSATTAAYTVVNEGTVFGGRAAVLLYAGGTLTNGAVDNRTALIEGPGGVLMGGPGVVRNFATIRVGHPNPGLYNALELNGGGVVINGSANDTTALIEGRYGAIGILDAPGTVANFGTIDGAIALLSGGRLTNGTATDTTALIAGDTGVVTFGPATIRNLGTIWALVNDGVDLLNGERLINGGTSDRKARIAGAFSGVAGGTDDSIVNFGTITASGVGKYDAGVSLSGGRVTNGTAASPGALIEGHTGVRLDSATSAASIINHGDIVGLAYGVYVRGHGQVINGIDGLIQGSTGLSLQSWSSADAVSVANRGEIIGSTAYGAVVSGYGSLSNGGPADRSAAIIGSKAGVLLTGGTVTNFATIAAAPDAAGACAVKSTTADSTLVVEAGSALLGAVMGGGGTLELACGAGTISTMGGGTIAASGAFVAPAFDNFGTLDIAKGSAFTLTGAGTIAAGGVATLDVEGTFRDAGTLDVSGTLAGGGVLQIVAGAQVNVDASLGYAGRWDQAGGSVATASGAILSLSGAGDTFTGTLSGAGTIAITGSGDVFRNVDLTAAAVNIGAAEASMAGTIQIAGLISLTCPDLVVSGVVARLTGGGTLKLSDQASNEITGATSTSLLDNAVKITGSGQIGAGSLRLTNEAAGIIDANASAGMTIDTGSATIINRGLIEAAGAGSLVIKGAVRNSGTLGAIRGDLTVDEAVTGGGVVKIVAATASFAGPFSEAVSFGSSGELVLAQSTAYAGTISHFSLGGATSLDLEDIAFGGTTMATYSGTAASGVLTVSDGTHTAHIRLAGDFTASTFTLSGDGHGGTTVVDPTRSGAMPLIAAIAGFAPAPIATFSHAAMEPVPHAAMPTGPRP